MLKRGAPKISSWGVSHNQGVLREGGGLLWFVLYKGQLDQGPTFSCQGLRYEKGVSHNGRILKQ